jgi:hypothetical protein
VTDNQYSYASDTSSTREELGELFGKTFWSFSLATFPVNSIRLPECMLALFIMNNLLHVLRKTDFTLDRAQFLYALPKNHRINLATCIIDLIASMKLSKPKKNWLSPMVAPLVKLCPISLLFSVHLITLSHSLVLLTKL